LRERITSLNDEGLKEKLNTHLKKLETEAQGHPHYASSNKYDHLKNDLNDIFAQGDLEKLKSTVELLDLRRLGLSDGLNYNLNSEL